MAAGMGGWHPPPPPPSFLTPISALPPASGPNSGQEGEGSCRPPILFAGGQGGYVDRLLPPPPRGHPSAGAGLSSHALLPAMSAQPPASTPSTGPAGRDQRGSRGTVSRWWGSKRVNGCLGSGNGDGGAGLPPSLPPRRSQRSPPTHRHPAGQPDSEGPSGSSSCHLYPLLPPPPPRRKSWDPRPLLLPPSLCPMARPKGSSLFHATASLIYSPGFGGWQQHAASGAQPSRGFPYIVRPGAPR